MVFSAGFAKWLGIEGVSVKGDVERDRDRYGDGLGREGKIGERAIARVRR